MQYRPKSLWRRKRLDAMTVNQHEWMPVMRIGARQIIQSSFSDTGAVNHHPNPDPMAKLGQSIGRIGDVFGALGGEEEEKPPGKLTAEWLDFEVQAPGAAPLKFRRQMDAVVLALPVAGEVVRLRGPPRHQSILRGQ